MASPRLALRGSLAWPLAGALLAGLLARLALLRLPRLWYDEATIGVMGLAVLRGELPVYFYGQPFMGALDAYLAAPLYVLLGVSARTLELGPVLLSLAWLGLLVRLAGEAFGPRGALWTAVVLAVPPDFLLWWSHEARPHYPLAMVLGTLALLLAWRAPGAPPGRGDVLFALTGATLGLGVWTNFLALAFVPAVGALLLRGGPRRFLAGGLMAAPAFVLGSLPHWLYGLAHRTAVPPAGGRIRPVELGTHLRDFGRSAWPVLAGVPGPLAARPAGRVLAGALALGYLAAIAGAGRAVRRGPEPARWVSLAALLVLAATLGVGVGTVYGRNLTDHDQRYLLPLYTALPLLAGGALAAAPPGRAAFLAGALVLAQAAGAATGSFLSLLPVVAAAERVEPRAQLDTIQALDRAGLSRLYAADVGSRVLTFLSDERVVFSQHYEEIVPRYARLVDGTPGAAWWVDRPSPVFEANLAALGTRFAYWSLGSLGGAYTAFRLEGPPLRDLDPAGWAVTASEGPGTASWVADRDAGTLWGTRGPRHGGEWLQVDLGAVVPVALVRWLPGTYQEIPSGLAVELSVDGRAWRRVVDLPEYVGPLYWSADRPMGRVRGGRVELRLPPTPARHLRLTQTGASVLWRWTVRELWVYAAAEDDGRGAPSAATGLVRGPDGATLATAVRAAGVTRLLADHGWGQRIALADPAIRVLPANLYLDAYGDRGSARDLLAPVAWGPGTGALVEPAEAAGLARLLAEAGLGFARRPVGGLELFAHAPAAARSGRPLEAAGLRARASRQPERAPLMLDGDRRTRWSTGRPQTAGDWVQVDLDPPRLVQAVTLANGHPFDYPRGLTLEGSEDGQRWRLLAAAVRRTGPFRWGGFTLARDGVETVRLEIAPVRLTALRITLTRGGPVYDWSIHELGVEAAD